MRRLIPTLAFALLLVLLPARGAQAATPFACFYENANYGGRSLCVNVTLGWRNFRDYDFLGWNPDNRVSSVCVRNGRAYMASGLSGNNYELLGRYTVYCQSYVGATWNDKASSFWIGYL